MCWLAYCLSVAVIVAWLLLLTVQLLLALDFLRYSCVGAHDYAGLLVGNHREIRLV